MAGALASYGFLNAKLKTRISALLPPSAIEELLRAKSLPEAVVLLKGTAYEAVEAEYSRTGDLRSGEALLYSMEVEYHTGLLRYAKEPSASLLRNLACRFEVDTLKNAIRLWFNARIRGRTTDGASVYLYRGRILHDLNLDALLAAPNAAALADALSDTPYEPVVRREGPRLETDKTLFYLESALDRQYYAGLLASLSELSARDRSIARRVLGVEIDMHNIEWLARAQGFYRLDIEDALACLIPGGRPFEASKTAEAYGTGNVISLVSELLGAKYSRFAALLGGASEQGARLAFLEQALREILRGESVRLLGGYPFTIGIALAYFALKHEEIRTLLAILNAKFYSLPEERIRNSL